MMRHDIRFTAQKIAQRIRLLQTLEYRYQHPLADFYYKILPDEHTSPHQPFDDTWEVLPPGTYWGGRDVNFCLRTEFHVPADFDAASTVALYFPLGDAASFSHPEALVYVNGRSLAACDRHHQEILLPADYRDGQTHSLLLHGWTGVIAGFTKKKDTQLVMSECAVVAVDEPTRELLAVARTALEAANMLDDLEPAQGRLYNLLDDAFKALNLLEPFETEFYESVRVTLDILRAGLAEIGPALDVELIAAGHAHIDVAWLWTLGQTRLKAGRTFHTTLRLMEQFPEYHFTQSQPQLYEYVREDYPELFSAIQAQVKGGQWEAIGGMWVEADCNISGNESLARQFILGRGYFRRYFGEEAESPVLWLPDVFGYAWNLPQLIKLAGLEYFFTIKIGWNQYNELPYDSFWWQGLDGTQVLTYFSTSPAESPPGAKPSLFNKATYTTNLNALSVLGTWAKSQHKDVQETLLMSYGYGDGGGGPTREMNENAHELANFPAMPQVRRGKVIDFFRQLEAESGDQLPTWNGELYLEAHRGTYTTQARNKRANRHSEFWLHDAEYLASQASLLDASYTYPHEALQKAWELVCLNQFHDIIPGSSIQQVYVESLEQYAEVAEIAQQVKTEALTILQNQVGGELLLINPTSFARTDLAYYEGEISAELADVYRTQTTENGVLIAPSEPVAAYSVNALSADQILLMTEASSPLSVSESHLENDYVRVEFNEAGDLVRFYDKMRHREILPEGVSANEFQAFEDRPLNWDAWDIDIFYDDKCYFAEPAHSIKIIEKGPLRATLEIERRILNSTITQRISLTYNSLRLDFATTVDWQERHILLKVAFPVDILTPVATYEIQWGSVERPTHRNTSWDWARFETCAQKWVSLGEGNYGIALLNDSKYGHDIQANIIRLSLLRSPTLPDPEADQGQHEFTYSLYPHSNLSQSDVAREAYALNNPLLVSPSGGTEPQSLSSLVTASNHTIIETVKQAEDGNGLIVRLYECNRQRGEVNLLTNFAVAEAYITNLLEDNQTELELEDTYQVSLNIKPFEIITVRLIADESGSK